MAKLDEIHVQLKVTSEHLRRRIRKCVECPFGRRYDPSSAEVGWGPRGRFKSCVHPTHPQKHADPDSPPPSTCELRETPLIYHVSPVTEEPFWLPKDEPARDQRTYVKVEGDTFSLADADPGDYPDDDGVYHGGRLPHEEW